MLDGLSRSVAVVVSCDHLRQIFSRNSEASHEHAMNLSPRRWLLALVVTGFAGGPLPPRWAEAAAPATPVSSVVIFGAGFVTSRLLGALRLAHPSARLAVGSRNTTKVQSWLHAERCDVVLTWPPTFDRREWVENLRDASHVLVTAPPENTDREIIADPFLRRCHGLPPAEHVTASHMPEKARAPRISRDSNEVKSPVIVFAQIG